MCILYLIPSAKLVHHSLWFIADLVGQDVAVTSIAVIHIQDSLVGILHGTLLDPGLDTLLSSEGQHLTNLIGATDQGTTQLQTLDDQCEGGDLQSTILRGTQLDEGTAEAEQVAVSDDGHLGGRSGGDDQVEGGSVLGFPVLVLTGGDEVISTELQGVLLLVRLAGDGDDAVGTESLGEEDTEVTETTNTDDTNGLAGATAVLAQRGVCGDTAAEHGGGVGRGDGIGDLDHEVGGSTVVGGVATVRLAAVGVGTVVGTDHTGAVLLETGGAGLTVSIGVLAGGALGTDTDTVTDLDIAGGLGTDADSGTDELVADAAGVVGGSLQGLVC